MTGVRVELLTVATDEAVAALKLLIPQLNPGLHAPDLAELDAILRSPTTHVFVARTEDAIVGTLTLATYKTISADVHAVIEGVVVDQSYRGRGIGNALVRHGLKAATEAGANGALLTSAPRREAANRLYERIGFRRIPTNVYLWRATNQNHT